MVHNCVAKRKSKELVRAILDNIDSKGNVKYQYIVDEVEDLVFHGLGDRKLQEEMITGEK
jgi:hypothetical protein